MDTPICDFIKKYNTSGSLRLHMPGHKGQPVLGMEALDITEIDGADVLYNAQGIILKSMHNAAQLFEVRRTFYSAEGSSLAIRAMLYLVRLYAASTGRPASILAARNAHKVFITSAALMDIDVHWLYPADGGIISCPLDMEETDRQLNALRPAALYVTSPDYLGNMADIAALSRLCKKYGTLLIVDNAHGAYLKFLPGRLHPMELGADMCCDSAHKTLPVLTGGAYLHISCDAPPILAEQAENALSIFASTSPSYLILQSLDAANAFLAGHARSEFENLAQALCECRSHLAAQGFTLFGAEPLKLTIAPKSYGYTGEELGQLLRDVGIECEFCDPDFLVMMFAAGITKEHIRHLTQVFLAIPRRPAITSAPPVLPAPTRAMSPHDALFSPQERIPVEEAPGRILASASVNCPPAVPIVVCGERIDKAAVECFKYYEIEYCFVVAR